MLLGILLPTAGADLGVAVDLAATFTPALDLAAGADLAAAFFPALDLAAGADSFVFGTEN